MRMIFVVSAILMFAAPLMAETYTWEDVTGTLNFTENYSSIPVKYRNKARKLGEMGPETSSSSPAAVSEKKAPALSTATAASGVSSASEANGFFGGKKPEAWQQEMRPLYGEVKRLEQQLAELDSLIRKPVGISKSRIDGLPQEFREAQKLYNQALKQYNRLNDEANKVGLPVEFRK